MSLSHTVEQPTELVAFLFAQHPEVKRTTVRQWLKHGSVQVNGRSVTRSNHPLKVGDAVSILAKREARAKQLLPAGLKVVFEDAALIVVEKPEDLLSVASATERDETVYAHLTSYVRRGNRRSRERVWIVHRLDREASGLMVFAKTEDAKRVLQARWSEVEKRYLAVVEGKPPADSGVLESHLDESRPFKVHAAARGGRTRRAVTHYRLVRQREARALVELTPETGRRNQIRVHLADAKCPIIGDRKYGARTNPARRLGLHACFLRFKHPSSGELLSFESILPRRLARAV